MSAYGTKKPGSDLTIQMGFPTNFEDAYAKHGQPLQFAPSVQFVATPFPAGDDEQAQYHQQKMMDAHRSVMNAVADTKRATQRALVSHAGYWAMPKAVLGQRMFANPSMGSGQVDIYKPIHRATPELTGGVLRSRQGQEYGQRLLQARIAQLNAIDEAAAGLQEGMPITDLSATQDLAAQPASGEMIKLVSYIDNINNVLDAGFRAISRFDAKDLSDFLLLLFRVAPQANREELENILEGLLQAGESAEEMLQDMEDADEAGVATTASVYGDDGTMTTASREADRSAAFSYALSFSTTVMLALRYVKQMYGAVDKSSRDRFALSRNLVKSLGFTKWSNITDRMISRATDVGIGEDDSTKPIPAPDVRALRGEGKVSGGRGGNKVLSAVFDRPALSREAEIAMETGVGRFNRDERQVFGNNSGRWYGQEYEQEAPTERGLREVSSAARNGIRNPFRAPGAAADARGEREFEEAVVREAPMMAQMPVVEQRKARMAAVAAAQQAARESARATMSAVGKGRSLSSRIMMRKGGMDIADQMTRGTAAPPPTGTTTPVAQASTRRKAPAKKAAKLPMKAPARGSGKPKLFNSAGKAHRGAFHQMPDGTYMSGAKHSKRSKPLTVA